MKDSETLIAEATRRMVISSRSALKTREASVIAWRTVAENRAKYTGPLPFQGATTATTPLTSTLAQTWAGQVSAPVLASVPMVMMEADREEEAEQVAALERRIHNTFVTCGFRQALPEWVKNAGTDGIGYLDVTWDEKKNRPTFRVLDSTDVGGFPADAPRPEDEIVSYRREMVYPAELKRRIATGGYDPEETKKALAAGITNTSLSDDMRHNLDRVWPEASFSKDPIEIFHCLVRWDPSHVDPDARPGEKMWELVVTEQFTLVAPRPYKYDHGKPTWHPLVAIPRTGDRRKFRYGISVVEMLDEQQFQHNAQRRQRFDLATLAMAVVTLVRKAAKINIKDFRPGALLETQDPEKDFKALSLRPPGANVDIQEESIIKEEARELLGMNQAAIGSASDTPLGVLQAAQAGTATRLDETEVCLEEAMSSVVDTTLALYEQFDPGAVLTPSAMDQLNFVAHEQGPVVATQAAYAMSKEALALRPRILLAAANKATNPILRAQMAEKDYMFSTNNPIIQSDPELVYKAATAYLRDTGHPAPERRLGSLESWLERSSAETPPPPPNMSITMRPDEISAVTLLIKNGLITEEEYMNTVAMAAAAAPLMPMRDPTMKPTEQLDNAVGPPVDMPMPDASTGTMLPPPVPEQPMVEDPAADMARMAEYAAQDAPPEVPVEVEDPAADQARMAEYANQT